MKSPFSLSDMVIYTLASHKSSQQYTLVGYVAFYAQQSQVIERCFMGKVGSLLCMSVSLLLHPIHPFSTPINSHPAVKLSILLKGVFTSVEEKAHCKTGSNVILQVHFLKLVQCWVSSINMSYIFSVCSLNGKRKKFWVVLCHIN